MPTVSLGEFIEFVPVCAETASLVSLWALTRQANSEQTIVVDAQQNPIGIVNLPRLTAYFWQLDDPDGELTPPALKFAFDSAEVSLREMLRQVEAETQLNWLTPLSVLPLQGQVEHLQPYLSAIAYRHWVAVDAAGNCVGLLDRLRILQFLVSHSLSASAAQPPVPPMALVPKPPLPASLAPLIDLLERLPLPLMVQTSQGDVVVQNLAWRQQIGELQDPDQVHQAAADVLEAIAPQPMASLHPLPASLSNSLQSLPIAHTTTALQDGWPAEFEPNPEAATNLCHLGTDLNSCVCICPMKNGQERIWQFAKVPLSLSAQPQRDSLASELSGGNTTHSLLDTPSFHLAALKFKAEQDWQPLMQAETLWLVLAQDTTEQQQVAKELAAKNADLVQLNRLKDEFLACISHELKTPLTAVLGLSSLLKDQALGALNERQARYARLIHQSGRHLISIVNDILDLTRIETGQLELNLAPVAIAAACQRAYEQARQLQTHEEYADSVDSEAELPFTLDIQAGLDTLVVDALRLRQMLTNLLSNALKFTEVGGKIGLKVDIWDGWIAFTVWDTGIGIPADKQHLIFQKFQQLENPLNRRFEGTGLGLVLTQRLARLHGGDVTFTSAEGVGSQFTLLLPPHPPSPTVGFSAPPTLASLRQAAHATTVDSRLVLVVEAVPQFLDTVTQELTRLGYRVAIARSGTEALEKIRRLQPAAVLLNPLLPMLSGWDVLTLLKADPGAWHIPIVITATQAEKDRATQNGADGFLSLPLQPDALHQSLERLIDPAIVLPSDATLDLTVLHLCARESTAVSEANASPVIDLSSLLHSHHCRVLEVDDLEQAELLARVWRPNIILLDGEPAHPVAYVKQLSQCPFLVAIPLVTLTLAMTQAANQVGGLAVFPCLLDELYALPGGTFSQPQIATLLQVMQVAAGTGWTPYVLLADFTGTEEPVSPENQLDGISHNQAGEWLQAAGQYIQTAGFRSSISKTWAATVEQLQHQGVDLFVLCLNSTTSPERLQKLVSTLEQLSPKPPVLVWNYPPPVAERSGAGYPELQAQIEAIATHILPPSLSLQELAETLRRILSP